MCIRDRYVAIRFFKGEDPWHLARSTPGLRHLAVAALEPWPAAEVFDCYRCNLDLLLVSDAPVAALHEHFRYVPEQVELYELTTPPAQPAGESAPLRLLRQRTAELWDVQRSLLASPGLNEGTLAAVRTAFLRLLACCDERGSWSGMISKSSGFATVPYLPIDASISCSNDHSAGPCSTR